MVLFFCQSKSWAIPTSRGLAFRSRTKERNLLQNQRKPQTSRLLDWKVTNDSPILILQSTRSCFTRYLDALLDCMMPEQSGIFAGASFGMSTEASHVSNSWCMDPIPKLQSYAANLCHALVGSFETCQDTWKVDKSFCSLVLTRILQAQKNMFILSESEVPLKGHIHTFHF